MQLIVLDETRTTCLENVFGICLMLIFNKCDRGRLDNGGMLIKTSQQQNKPCIGDRWLAKKLTNESQTEFLIEKMQPTWLPDPTSLRLYLIGVGLIVGLIVGLVGGLIGGLMGALIRGLSGPDIEKRKVPNQGIWLCAVNARIFALIGGLTLGLIFGLLTSK